MSSEITVPAELINHAAYTVEVLRLNLHLQWKPNDDDQACMFGCCKTSRLLVAELRALLLQPAPTPACPNCGHPVAGHREATPECGCDPWCDCPFSADGAATALTLVAAERDSKPAGRRAWLVGDPEPADLPGSVFDKHNDLALLRPDGYWWPAIPEMAPRPWSDLLRGYGPLTEVLDGDDR
jgi:hypothetical protein